MICISSGRVRSDFASLIAFDTRIGRRSGQCEADLRVAAQLHLPRVGGGPSGYEAAPQPVPTFSDGLNWSPALTETRRWPLLKAATALPPALNGHSFDNTFGDIGALGIKLGIDVVLQPKANIWQGQSSSVGNAPVRFLPERGNGRISGH